MNRQNSNFARALTDTAAAGPDRPCLLLADDHRITYGELDAHAGRMATVLARYGVRAGDRVVAQAGKSPALVALYLGCLRLGAVYVPLNGAYTAAEVGYFLEDAEPAAFVCDPGRAGEFAAGAVPLLTLADDGASGSLADAAAEAESMATVAHRDAGDLAAIVYTSGTTGRSKGAMLSHGNLDSNARVLLTAWGWRDDDVLLHALPIFHVHGLFVALHCALLSGTAMVFLPRFDAAEVARWLPRATVMMGVPTFYTRLLERAELDRDRCHHVRLFVSGSAPLTEQTFRAWEERTGHQILERYGMSETLMNVSNPLDGERVPGTVGFALPGVAVRIADEVGRERPRGEVGVIEVRGPNVFSGYWRMPGKSAEEFRADGYFVTGDLGRMADDGRVTIVGRAKDLIISGGYNVYPKEVERLLDELPGVRESAVIGVPHPDFGEAVVAVLVADGDCPDGEAVRHALSAQLARFKQPKAVVRLEALPRNAMGKVQKNALREQYAGLFAGP